MVDSNDTFAGFPVQSWKIMRSVMDVNPGDDQLGQAPRGCHPSVSPLTNAHETVRTL